MIKLLSSTLLVIVILLLSEARSNALSVETHESINSKIAETIIPLNGFLLDAYLKKQLNFENGYQEEFKTQSVSKWIKDGGRFEDLPLTTWNPVTWLPYQRSFNHFHDPLVAIDKAGYSFFGLSFLQVGESAILWSQREPEKQRLGYYSWHDVRKYFYNALTMTDKTSRDTNFAELFRGVGHLMHIVQDMSVPEHSRNDGHVLDAYEEWVRDSGDSILDAAFANPIYFDLAALAQPSPFSEATVPIARMFDSNQYAGQNPDITAIKVGDTATIGLSEYSNANFVSADTIFKNYPYPKKDVSTVNSEEVYPDPLNPGKSKIRPYYKKIAAGETNNGSGYRLAGIGYLHFTRPPLSPGDPDDMVIIHPMDAHVFEDYAKLLLPRAVGYSATMLNYFFRGTMQLTLPAQGVYATAAPGGTFNEIRVKAKNTTTTGEEMSNGTFQLVVKYNLSLDDPFQSILVDLGPDAYIVVPEKNGATAISKTTPTELIFDLSTTPLPIWAANVSLQVVFKGKLGNELNAVAVGYSDISEPTPVDVYNNTDYSCLNSTWYSYNDPAAMTIVDSNHDGIADRSDIYRHNITNISFLGGPATAGTLNAAASNNLFAAGPLQPGQLLRMGYILTDYSYRYALNENRIGVGGDPFIHATVNNRNFSGTGFQNDWNTQDSMFSFRGQNLWWGSGVVFTNAEYNGTCTLDALSQMLGY